MPWQMTRVFLSTKTAGGGGEAAAKERDCNREYAEEDDDEVNGDIWGSRGQIVEDKDLMILLACLAIWVISLFDAHGLSESNC